MHVIQDEPLVFMRDVHRARDLLPFVAALEHEARELCHSSGDHVLVRHRRVLEQVDEHELRGRDCDECHRRGRPLWWAEECAWAEREIGMSNAMLKAAVRG